MLSKEREDGSKEDETIVNRFHGVSSSSEVRRDVCGQTDQGSWILLERAHVKWRSEFAVSTGLWYPMTSSLIAKILDNTQTHSSATLRWLVRSVGLNESSYTAKTRMCLRMQVVCLCRGWCTQRVWDDVTLTYHVPLAFFCFQADCVSPGRWDQCGASVPHGWDNFQKLILTLTDSLSWYR